ncbi:zinc finger, CCHC-type containing protein [Tanacetum coccineum]|uniref:Zinc finger, CCHC-type containing protein n=1 Tax=Tanacetum coccineum TaxID=301880 RepID=A0ABQ5GZA2_9ASTR
MLEAVADQQLWFWHTYFRVPGANNDLNVLHGSPLFDDLLADKAPEAPFQVNEKTYEKGYYLADEIYPQWATFVKAFSITRDQKTMKFKRVQKSARKDIERAFGVLQERFRTLVLEFSPQPRLATGGAKIWPLTELRHLNSMSCSPSSMAHLAIRLDFSDLARICLIVLSVNTRMG